MLLMEIGLNLLVAVLLAVTIMYCVALNKRIRLLQDSRAELAQLLKHFDESTRRATASIDQLQQTSQKMVHTINARMDKASFVADDLMLLIERAGKLSHTLEAGMAVNRASTAEARQEDKAASLQAMIEKIASGGVSDPSLRGQRSLLGQPGGRPQSKNQSKAQNKAAGKASLSRIEQDLAALLETEGQG